mmetsp:Transcript_114159/g.198441  ORF Transcript_114159/g.198441 Transcript_114159/m.198441 type:complete len:352 (-) Transcript_114159:944-1999(-)
MDDRRTKSVELDILRTCIGGTQVNPDLAGGLAIAGLVQRAIVYQCRYIAQLMYHLKAIGTESKRGKEAHPATHVTYLSSRTSSAFQLQIGIIGCGNVGTALLEDLVGCGLFHKTCFHVSTRQPNQCQPYFPGIHFCFDNPFVAKSVDLLFLCCPPAHISSVTKDIKGVVPKHAIIFCVCAGVPAHRLQQMVDHPHCLTTQLRAHVIGDHFKGKQIPAKPDQHMKRDLLILASLFGGPQPPNTLDFVEQLVCAMATTWVHRGFSLSISMRLVLGELFGKRFSVPDALGDPPPGIKPDAVPPDEVRLQQCCSVQFIARQLACSQPAELVQQLKQRYMETLMGDVVDSPKSVLT